MDAVWVTSSLETVLTPTAVALGNFDGIHRGHHRVIQSIFRGRLDNLVSDQACSGDNVEAPKKQEPLPGLPRQVDVGSYATVVTFNPHPQEFFTGQPRALLTPLPEKAGLLKSHGIEQLVLLPFDRELASLSPEAFVKKILVQQLQAEQVSVGFDFCFGYQRSGTAADLEAIATAHGIQVTVVSPHTCGGERISSSAIRQALQQGNLQRANQLLGRPYTLIGKVVQGQQLGQTIGFPTANLAVPTEKFLPCQGVYAVRVQGSGLDPQIGVMNLGHRPTVNGLNQTIEVHLLNWSGNLYGQTLTVDLEHFLRSEQKFNSLEELKAQIGADCAAARSYLVAIR